MRGKMEDEYITITEAATLLQTSPTFVHWLINEEIVRTNQIAIQQGHGHRVTRACIGVSLLDIQQEMERKRTEGRRKHRSPYELHPPPDGMLSVRDAALKMGVSPMAINLWKRNKRLPVHNIDGFPSGVAIAEDDLRKLRNISTKGTKSKMAPPEGLVLLSSIAKHIGKCRQLIHQRYSAGKIAVAQELHYPNRLVVTQEEYDRVVREDAEKKAQKLMRQKGLTNTDKNLII